MKRFKDIFLSGADFVGVNKIFRLLSRHKVRVLTYHGVVPDDCQVESWALLKESEFKKQMEYLSKCYDVISIQEALEYISSTKKNISRPKVVITFDDGYRNNYLTAFPILKLLNFPATIFLVTDFVNSDELFWFDKIIYSIQSTKCINLDLGNFGVFKFNTDNEQERWDNIQDLLEKLKKEDNANRLKIIREIENTLKPEYESSNPFLPLQIGDIQEMLSTRLIELGSHTNRHEILTQLSINDAENTISKSIDVLEKITNEEVRCLSYPNGNFNTEIKKLLMKKQMRACFTTISGFWSSKNDILEIPRIGIGAYDSIVLFKAQLSGLFDNILRLVK